MVLSFGSSTAGSDESSTSQSTAETSQSTAEDDDEDSESATVGAATVGVGGISLGTGMKVDFTVNMKATDKVNEVQELLSEIGGYIPRSAR